MAYADDCSVGVTGWAVTGRNTIVHRLRLVRKCTRIAQTRAACRSTSFVRYCATILVDRRLYTRMLLLQILTLIVFFGLILIAVLAFIEPGPLNRRSRDKRGRGPEDENTQIQEEQR